MEEQKTKKKFNKKYLTFGVVALFALAFVTAVVINELSDRATVEIEVTHAMGVEFLESGLSTLVLTPTTAMSTFEFGLFVENYANNEIIAPFLKVTLDDGMGTTTCSDLTSVKFTDTWCTGEYSETCPEQELIGLGLCSISEGKAVYTIPTEKYLVGQSTEYPITATFGNVDENTYTIEAEMVIA